MPHSSKFPLIVSIVLILITTSFLPSLSAQTPEFKNNHEQVSTPNCSLLRIPEGEVHSYQSVIILSHVPGNHDVSLQVNITLYGWVKGLLNNSINISYSHTIPMIPLPQNNNWYISSIPGLPASVHHGILISWDIKSKVNYTLQIDNNPIWECSGEYQVTPTNYTSKLPPIIYTMPYEVYENKDFNALSETFGLGPKGWSLENSQDYKVFIMAIDDRGFQSINNITFSYKVDNASWESSLVTEESDIIGGIENIISPLNQLINTINSWLDNALHLPPIEMPVMAGYATIPSQDAGSYVKYIANVTDSNNLQGHSPYGFYYVDSSVSTTNILIIDPNLYLWVIQQSTSLFKENVETYIQYKIPNYLMGNISTLRNYSSMISQYVKPPFRFWNYLGRYKIYITRVSSQIPSLLNELHPNVIILSDLWLGLKSSQTSSSHYKDFWDWDLMDTYVNGSNLFTYLKNYIKTNHAGLIVTGGTLSDEVLWISSEEKIKIGTRGHVGNNLTDINVDDEKTVAAMLGMQLLPLWEYLRDEIANKLISVPSTRYLGMLIGSTPLQIPFVPFNGSFSSTAESNYMGWDIPSNFTIKIPLFYSHYGFNAYTQVGWQLGMPSTIAYIAWQMANKMKGHSKSVYENLTYLAGNLTSNNNISEKMLNATTTALHSALSTFYNAIQNATINGSKFNLMLNLSKINNTASVKEILLNISKKAFDELLQLMPTKLVALSTEYLAGILTYDKYWDERGYRSVYFSFDVESSQGFIAKKLLNNAVNWTLQWEYKNITTLLGNLVRVPKSISEEYNRTVSQINGTTILNKGILLNEQGYSTVNLTFSSGREVSMVIVHPTTDNIDVAILNGSGEISWYNVSTAITVINITASTPYLVVGIQAHCDAILNPAYITVKEIPTIPEFPSVYLLILLLIGITGIYQSRKERNQVANSHT